MEDLVEGIANNDSLGDEGSGGLFVVCMRRGPRGDMIWGAVWRAFSGRWRVFFRRIQGWCERSTIRPEVG